MKIYENGVLREATAEEIAEAARAQEEAEKVIVQMTLQEVMQYLAPKLFADVPDKDALRMVDCYPKWKAGIAVATGERYQYNGKLYKVVQPHTTQADWTPDITPALYTEVSVVEWAEWVQPLGSEDAYRIDAKVAHNDKHWISEIDYNTYEPGVYGWREA